MERVGPFSIQPSALMKDQEEPIAGGSNGRTEEGAADVTAYHLGQPRHVHQQQQQQQHQ